MSGTPRWAVDRSPSGRSGRRGLVDARGDRRAALAVGGGQAEPGPGRARRAHRLFDQADALFDQKRYEEARPLYQEAAALYERVIDDYNRAVALENLGLVEHNLRRYPEAATVLPPGPGDLRPQRASTDRSAAVNAHLGDVARATDRYEDARQFYQRARALLDPAKDQKQVARVALLQGVTEDEMHALDAAADFYAQAAALAAEADDPGLLGQIAEGMARVEQQRNRPAQARELLENALPQYGAAGDQAAQARVRGDLAQLDAAHKRAPEPRN